MSALVAGAAGAARAAEDVRVTGDLGLADGFAVTEDAEAVRDSGVASGAEAVRGPEVAGSFAAASLSRLTIITGHYGVGKTNLSLNLARDVRAEVERVTLVDLDIVNPYFRSTDNQAFLDARDIEVLGPVHGASNLDTPSLSPGIDRAIRVAGEGHAVLIDVGGDPDGARALGRFSALIDAKPHQTLFVVNLCRPEAASVADNLALLRGIEETSGLLVTGIFGNTHLKEFTTAAGIVKAVGPTRALAEAAGLPLVGIAAPRPLAAEVASLLTTDGALRAAEVASLLATASAPTSVLPPRDNTPSCSALPVYPVDLIVGTPWEE
jgi:hypothetical protein